MPNNFVDSVSRTGRLESAHGSPELQERPINLHEVLEDYPVGVLTRLHINDGRIVEFYGLAGVPRAEIGKEQALRLLSARHDKLPWDDKLQEGKPFAADMHNPEENVIVPVVILPFISRSMPPLITTMQKSKDQLQSFDLEVDVNQLEKMFTPSELDKLSVQDPTLSSYRAAQALIKTQADQQPVSPDAQPAAASPDQASHKHDPKNRPVLPDGTPVTETGIFKSGFVAAQMMHGAQTPVAKASSPTPAPVQQPTSARAPKPEQHSRPQARAMAPTPPAAPRAALPAPRPAARPASQPPVSRPENLPPPPVYQAPNAAAVNQQPAEASSSVMDWLRNSAGQTIEFARERYIVTAGALVVASLVVAAFISSSDKPSTEQVAAGDATAGAAAIGGTTADKKSDDTTSEASGSEQQSGAETSDIPAFRWTEQMANNAEFDIGTYVVEGPMSVDRLIRSAQGKKIWFPNENYEDYILEDGQALSDKFNLHLDSRWSLHANAAAPDAVTVEQQNDGTSVVTISRDQLVVGETRETDQGFAYGEPVTFNPGKMRESKSAIIDDNRTAQVGWKQAKQLNQLLSKSNKQLLTNLDMLGQIASINNIAEAEQKHARRVAVRQLKAYIAEQALQQGLAENAIQFEVTGKFPSIFDAFIRKNGWDLAADPSKYVRLDGTTVRIRDDSRVTVTPEQ